MAERLGERLRDGLRVLAYQPLLFVLAVLAGGALGVGYTCGPLHGAKEWRLDYLDTQLGIQNERVRDLELELARRLESHQTSSLAVESAELEELAQAAEERDRLTQRAESADEELAKAMRSRDEWRSKYRSADAQLSQARQEKEALAAERDALLARLSAVGSSSAPPPAALDPGSTILADNLELMVGESWSSPGGQVSFEVVDVDKDVASLRGSWQSAMAGPERVSAGHELSEQRDDTTYRISITAVSPYRSVTIRAASDTP